MKTLLKITIVCLSLTLLNCKKNTGATFNDYKFAKNEPVLNCTNLDTKLFDEALLSFENDIDLFYNKRNIEDVRVGYNNFYKLSTRNAVKFQEIVSPHSMKVFEALKQQPNLWNADNTLNYEADIFNCIVNNLNSNDLKTTFKALIETNSMRLDIILPPIQYEITTVNKDKYLGAFIALEMYYKNLFEIDPNQVTEKPEPEK